VGETERNGGSKEGAEGNGDLCNSGHREMDTKPRLMTMKIKYYRPYAKMAAFKLFFCSHSK